MPYVIFVHCLCITEELVLARLQSAFDVIVLNIGRDWRPLARALGLLEGDIDHISAMYSTNLREQCREALKVWVRTQIQTQGSADRLNKRTLIKALERCEKRRIAQQVQAVL